jgi:SAM-dependent methyltransferase
MTPHRTENGATAMPNAYPAAPDPQAGARVAPPPTVTSAPRTVTPDSLRSAPLRLLADHWAVQIDAYTWRRYALMKHFLPHGPINALNIGTGGGVETLRLLRRGNRVTTIDADHLSARRTRVRAERWGYFDHHQGKVGHVLQVDVAGPFQLVLMAEVLEHVADDFGALRRIAGWLAPGGRLVLSTPTASHGMLPGDTLSAREDGGHVRPGYDGPELDAMLARLGLITLHRLYNCGVGCCWQHRVERRLRSSRVTRLLGYAFGVACRPMMPLLDAASIRPSDQITIAAKLP